MGFKVFIRRFTLFILGIIFFRPLFAQVEEYKHPLYDIGFTASPAWDRELHDDNGKVFEVTNPNNNMRVCLSYISDCRNPQRYMKRLSGLKGLIYADKPYDTILNNRRVVVLKGMCLQGKEPFRKMMVGIPDEHGLYLMEFACPEECYQNHRVQMRSIMGSLRVGA